MIQMTFLDDSSFAFSKITTGKGMEGSTAKTTITMGVVGS
jgi:hypothetical protein